MPLRDHRKPTVAPSAIQDLAVQMQRPVEEVRRVYEEQLAILEAEAKVNTYITLFAMRRTREVLADR